MENSGFPRWNIQISSKLISWNSLNIKSHHQLVNLHEFLEIGPIEKNSLNKNFYFEVLNKVHLMIYVHFGFIMTFIVPSELSENTIIVVYTKSVSILSPTPVQTIIKINWKWIFHVMILYQFQERRRIMKNWSFLIVFCTLTSKHEINPHQKIEYQNSTQIQFEV